MLKNTLQKDYTALGQYYQLKLPLELDVLIPANEPVRLLSAFVEDLSLSDLYSTYRRIRKIRRPLVSSLRSFSILIWRASTLPDVWKKLVAPTSILCTSWKACLPRITLHLTVSSASTLRHALKESLPAWERGCFPLVRSAADISSWMEENRILCWALHFCLEECCNKASPKAHGQSRCSRCRFRGPI